MKCALVTTAGSLLNYSFGAEIDRADCVIRAGQGPTRGFEKFVGSKTHVRVIAPSLFQKFRQINLTSTAVLLDSSQLVVLLSQVSSPSMELQASLKQARMVHVGPSNPCKTISSPTTGMRALSLSFSLLGCSTTRVFGAEDKNGSTYHYFSDKRKDGSDRVQASKWYKNNKYHDFIKEHALLRRLSSDCWIRPSQFRC